MMRTRPAGFIGEKERTYVLAVLLPKGAQLALVPFLRYLSKALPDVVWPMPLTSLHTTLYELMQRGDFGGIDKDALFEHNKAVWQQELAEIFSATAPISLAFTEVHVSPDAITLRCKNSDDFNEIRSRIGSRLALPSFTKAPPDITHCTVARFLTSVDMQLVERAIAAFRPLPRINLAMQDVQLIKTSFQPVLGYEILQRFSLLSPKSISKTSGIA
jgi:hypothetical protein